MKNFNLFFKKSFISFLCLTILLASFPASVFADSLKITEYNGSTVGGDEIPIGSDPTFKAEGGTKFTNSFGATTGNTGSSGGTTGTGGSNTFTPTNKNSDDFGFSVGEVTSNQAIQSQTSFNPATGDGSVESSNNSSVNSINKPDEDDIWATQETGSSAESGAISEGVSCAVGKILANGISGIVGKGVSTIFSTITNKQVPVDPEDHKSKEVGMLVVWGIPILPSWDAIAYCLANVIITYVADSTIAWIQSGFKGKPAFVDDPTKLFEDIADYEMSTFIEGLQDGLLCDDFSSQVTSALVNEYTDDYQSSGKCALGELESGVTDLVNGVAGSFTYGGWFNMSQNQNNNAAGALLKAKDEYPKWISAKQGAMKSELDQNKGYRSFRAADGTNKGKIVTFGSVIETQLSNTLKLAPERLVLAEKFDQVVSTLVNYLIKTALTETLGAVKKVSN